MNTSTFIWFLLAVQLVKSESGEILKDSSVGAKLDDLVAEYKALDPPKDDLFNPEPIASENFHKLHDPISVRVIHGGLDKPFHYHLNTSTVLLFDSVQNFVEHVRSIKWVTNKRFRHPHLVYIPGVTMSDIIEHIEDGFQIDNVGFLLHEANGSIGLATSFMFTKEKCRTNQLVKINRFTNIQVGWEETTFYPEKYKNFYGCSLNVSINDRFEQNDHVVIEDIIATDLNVRVNVNVSIKDSDLLAGLFGFEGDENYITSDTLWAQDVVYVVPLGEPYSQFEKMFLPFDLGTWIAICLTFLLAFITVEAVKLCPMKVQNFVFGRNFRTPTLNILDNFLNGGQRKFPGRNFSRYILNLFTIWCLIIRTCYQSKTFEFLQADMRKPGPTSFEDMGYTAKDNERGFDFNLAEDVYTPTEYGVPMNRTKFAICMPSKISLDGSFNNLMIVSDPANKAFTVTSDHLLIDILNNRFQSGHPAFVILEKRWRTDFIAFRFKKFCPFYQKFNHKIGFSISSGIPQHKLESKIRTKGRGLTLKEEDLGPQVLTLEDLEIGFIIHLVCLSISTMVFFLELIPIRVKRFVRKVIMLNVIAAYIRNLYPGGAKLPQKRLVKLRRKPLKPKPKFIKVKPKPPSNSRVQLDIHAEVTSKAESLNPKLGEKESLPQCPTESASELSLVDLQARSSTHEVGAEKFGSLETSIDDIVGPRPEVQTTHYKQR